MRSKAGSNVDSLCSGILNLLMSHSYPEKYFDVTVSNGRRTFTREETLQRLSPYKRHLAAFIDNLPKNARVLDIGCGSGRAVRIIQSLRPDISVEACDINDVREFLPSGVPFIICSGDEVSGKYPAAHFDGILCQHVIEHLAVPMGLAEGMHAILKSGGRVFIETPNWTRLFIPFSHNFFWNDYTHIRPFAKFTLIKLLSDYSFEVDRAITCSSSTWFNRRAAGKERNAENSPKPPPKDQRCLCMERIFRPCICACGESSHSGYFNRGRS